MKLKKLKPEHLDELKRIQSTVPKELLDKLIVKVQPAKEMIEVLKKAMTDETLTEEQRRKARLIVESGKLEVEKEEEDEEIVRQIDEYIQKEIYKSINRGTLPRGKKLGKLNK